MTKPTSTQIALLAEIEHHTASLDRLLDILEMGLQNAEATRDRHLARAINEEITYTIRQLAEVKARGDALRRDLGANEKQ